MQCDVTHQDDPALEVSGLHPRFDVAHVIDIGLRIIRVAPFGQQRRVVIRRFGKRAHGIGKGQRLGKVAETEGFLQLCNGIAGFDLPASHPTG